LGKAACRVYIEYLYVLQTVWGIYADLFHFKNVLETQKRLPIH